MEDEVADKLKKLREDFPAASIGKLPKAGVTLDFVGHAVVTGRLLDTDLEWNWEPMAKDERGSPALDKEGNLWIKLTICGVSRYGVGDGPTMKIRIGDAIRNAAMRFGVALNLWTRDELESNVAPPPAPPQPPPGMVFAADAKKALVLAYEGDTDRAKIAWGSRGSGLIDAGELDAMLQVAQSEVPA